MSSDNMLSRVSTIDFFGVLIPGLYLTSNLLLLAFAFVDPKETTDFAWIIINDAIVGFDLNKLLLLLLVAYLSGSATRVFPVNVIDKISGWINQKISRNKSWKEESKQKFPYVGYLNKLHVDINQNNSFTLTIEPQMEPEPMSAFNYWKAVVTRESPNLVAQIRAAEAKVRMFAGIVWVTGFSLILSLIALSFSNIRYWWPPFVISACISFTLLLIFIIGLRPMRREESRAVYLAFLSIHRN